MAATVWVLAVGPGVAAVGSCRLSVAYAGTTSGLGSVSAYFRVRNRGTRRCRLRRTPDVTLIGPRGRRLIVHERPDALAFAPVASPISVLMPGGRAHFNTSFTLLADHGRCAPAAVTALVRLAAADDIPARATLPTLLGKLHEPINPCPGATFLVSRIAPGA